MKREDMVNSDLSRFMYAHENSYRTALGEIQNGKKMTHWMWYIFPQIHGIGRSSTSQYYAIQTIEEAKAFLLDPYLGGNLREISHTLLGLTENNPTTIFGKPDDRELKSCMTLFASISEDSSVFHQVLDKFFNGRMDERTLSIRQRH